MDTFACIIYPIDPKRNVNRKYPFLARQLNEQQKDFFSTFFPPVYISRINGIVSKSAGKEVKSWSIACPCTPQRMMELSEQTVYRKIIQTGAVLDEVCPEDLQPGSFVCDVARPRDVSAMVKRMSDDKLVIDGGMVDVRDHVDFDFNFGFPPGKAYACLAETITQALEGCFEDYTFGKDITRQQVNEKAALAAKHAFYLSGFCSFEQDITQEQIKAVCCSARQARLRQ